MGERKGTNKYYPPDFDPKKHKSLAGYTGAHPLRERARKLHLGILIIRFEMPYNIWCDGCNSHIGMGVRYNAEKSKIGNYYTTPIWKFRMKCHLCDNHFEIKTDPGNHDYVIISGARRKEQRWDPKENEQIVPEDKSTQKKLALDPMYKLEHGATDKDKSKDALPAIGRIQQAQLHKKDDYLLNKLARTKFRDEKKSLKSLTEADNALLEKSSLDIKLVKENEDDVKIAGLIKYNSTDTYDEKQIKKRNEINQRPLFDSAAAASPSTAIRQSPKSYAQSHLKNLATIGKQKKHSFSTAVPKNGLSSSSLGIVRRKRPAEPDSVPGTPSSQQSDTTTESSDNTDIEREMSTHFLPGSDNEGSDEETETKRQRLSEEGSRDTRVALDAKTDDSARDNSSSDIRQGSALGFLEGYNSDSSSSNADQ